MTRSSLFSFIIVFAVLISAIVIISTQILQTVRTRPLKILAPFQIFFQKIFGTLFSNIHNAKLKPLVDRLERALEEEKKEHSATQSSAEKLRADLESLQKRLNSTEDQLMAEITARLSVQKELKSKQSELAHTTEMKSLLQKCRKELVNIRKREIVV